ncbi:hypothetical protein [Kitasatospora sp. MAP12-22]
MPPLHTPEQPAAEPSYDECAKCHAPMARAGICRPCAGYGTRVIAVGGGAAATVDGAGRARAAMRAARTALGIGRPRAEHCAGVNLVRFDTTN